MFRPHAHRALEATRIFLLCMAGFAEAKAQAPAQAKVLAWLVPDFHIKFGAKNQRIVMRGGEVAYLFPVTLTEAGRNASNAIVLARPKEKSAQFMAAENATLGAIHKAGKSAVSLVEVISSGSGQGTTSGGKSLVLFDGWETVELHGAEEGDNLGSCGQRVFQRDCYSIRVQWTLRDVDRNGFRDLIETTISGKGAEPEAMSSITVVTRYRMKDLKFIAEPPKL